MNRGRIFVKFATLTLASFAIASCSSLPGLRVLSGQTSADAASTDLAVQSLDLVMADKSGSTDPALAAAADRIEAANGTVDIIEIKKDVDLRVFSVDMLFNPPQTDTTTQQGQLDAVEYIRRAFEMTWLGMMRDSDGTDVFDIRLILPGRVPTLDHGPSLIGYVYAEGKIDRSAAASYLAGQRNLSTFEDLVVTGAFDYQVMSSFTPYDGTPNHPLYMLSASQGQNQ